MIPKNKIFRVYGANVLRGLLMGGADIVPGVSGGTVALILGIYERLVTAISHVDRRLLRLIRRRRWVRAAAHVDLWFLLSLACGILLGFVVMTTLMHHLLSHERTRALTYAMFFGLILASGIVVALMVRTDSRRQRVRCVMAGIAGAVFALWLTGLSSLDRPEPHLAYIFCAGAIAICAMILPGVSGAMVLLILGVYIHLTEIPGNVVHGQNVPRGVLTVIVFATGCALGLVTFSKLLRWLLARYHAVTMATLCGFMLGSLRKLWPFQQDVTPWIEKVKFKKFRSVMPAEFDSQVVAVIFVAITGVLVVFLADWFTHGYLRNVLSRSKRAENQRSGRGQEL